MKKYVAEYAVLESSKVVFYKEDACSLQDALLIANKKDINGEGIVYEYTKDKRAEGGWFASAIYDTRRLKSRWDYA